jgi:peptidoglycan/LPS O-acetylase OafA/YrhL
MNYRREIDGLRALAVIPVILFHSGVGVFRGGFVGVDVFFVISGFLITTILIEDVVLRSFSITNFYERRARRILPALLLMLICVTCITWWVMPPDDFKNVCQQLISNATFTSNIHYTLIWGYFERWKLPPVFLNTWSLAVEEQFYIVIPLTIYILRKNLKLLAIVLFVLLVASLLCAQLSFDRHPIANYYLLSSRFWELDSGALLAIMLRIEAARVGSARNFVARNRLDLVLGFALLLSYVYTHEGVPYPSLWTLPVVLISASIIAFVTSDTMFGRILSGRVLVYIGKISYPLYLWHFPLIVLARYLLVPLYSESEAAALAVVLTVPASILTYHFVEQPFRTRTLLVTKAGLLSTSTSALVLLSLAGYLGHTDTVEARSLIDHPQLAHLTENASLPHGLSMSSCAARNSRTQCRLIDNITDNSNGRRVLVVGDSFAANLIAPIYELLSEEKNLSLDARLTYACSYMPSRYAEWRGECGLARKYVDQLDRELATDLIFHIDFVEWLQNKNSAKVKEDLASLTDMFTSLLAKNIRVHVIGHRDVYTLEPKRAFLFPWLKPFLKPIEIPTDLERNYTLWRQLGVNVIYAKEPISKSLAYRYYSDRGHMTPKGAKEFSEHQGLCNTATLWPNKV